MACCRTFLSHRTEEVRLFSLRCFHGATFRKMQIQVPSQLPPDRKIVVLSPSGQQVSVTVPHHVMPGQMLQVQVP